MSNEAEASKLLSGVQVLDFTVNAAGPYAVWLFAALGARVVKVESHNRPDPARGMSDRPYIHSSSYDDCNSNKLSVALDLTNDQDRKLAVKLAERSDAVVSSFRPGVMDRLGLGHEELLGRKPSLVVASMSATGSTGPFAGLPGYASVFNALGGLGSLTGYPGGPPTELRTSIDFRAGAFMSGLIAWSLRDASLTGRGRYIDFAATEAVAFLVGEYLTNSLSGGEPVEERIGNRDEHFCPQGVYAANDGRWVAIAVQNAAEWASFQRMIGDVATESADRDVVVARWVGSKGGSEVIEGLARVGIAAEIVSAADDVAGDRQLAARGYFQPVAALDGSGDHLVAGVPFLVNGARARLRPARALGVDTEPVLADIFSPAHATGRHPVATITNGDHDKQSADKLRVLELGVGAAVPAAGRILTALGADVLKVEIPPDGDWTRSKRPLVYYNGDRVGALFVFLNAGKRSIALDPSAPDAELRLSALWEWADVVLIDDHYYRQDVVRRQVNHAGPTVITYVTPFGLTGPDAGRPASSLTIFARSGEGGITPGGRGYKQFPDEAPLMARGKVTEIDAGIVAVFATVASLIGGHTGSTVPTVIDLSIFETSVSHNRWIPSIFVRTGWVETRASASYPYGGMMPCQDGHAMIMPSTDRFWTGLVVAMGSPEWALSEELKTQDGRAAADSWVRPLMTEWSLTQTKEQLLRSGLEHGMPIAPYRTIDEVAACPQMASRNFLLPYGESDDRRIPGLPAPGMAAERGDITPPPLGATRLSDIQGVEKPPSPTTQKEQLVDQ